MGQDVADPTNPILSPNGVKNGAPMSTLNNTVAVIRCYSNGGIVKQVKALRSFMSRVVVVTNGLADKGATRAWLEELNDPCVDLIEMNEGYTWSNALNRALHHIRMLNAQKDAGIEFVFNVSVEALFRKEHVEQMLAEFADDNVGVVGTSFEGYQEGNVISLGRSYRHPRNTGMIVRLDVFGQPMLGLGFDPFCDDIGGMEDIDFIYRMIVFSGKLTKMLDLRVRLIVGKHHNQNQKEERERDAMEKIFNRYQQWSSDLINSVVTAWRLLAD